MFFTPKTGEFTLTLFYTYIISYFKIFVNQFYGVGKSFLKIFTFERGMSNGKKLKHLLEKTEDGILYKDEIEDIDF